MLTPMEGPWRYLPVSKLASMRPTAPQKARGLLQRARDRIWPERSRGASEADLRTPPEPELDRLTPSPPRATQDRAVHAARREAGRAVLVRPSSGAWDDALDRIGASGTPVAPVPEAPPDGTTLPRELAGWLDAPEPFHVPRLERWFVRDHAGLGMLRTLLAALLQRAGPWSVDVSPWAWTWMRGVLPEARVLPESWGPEPLDGDQTEAWLDAPDELWLHGTRDAPERDVYEALAARCYGDAGVIAAVWRASLAHDAAGERPWLRRLGDVSLPDLEGSPRDTLVVLHAALLHGDARADTLLRALPFAAGTVTAALAELEGRGVLRRGTDERYRVRAAAVPGARMRLRAESFPGVVA